MRLHKWHGLGNDYLLLDARVEGPEDPATLSRVLSDRRRGPGGDGLILLEKPTRVDADVRMSIWNADGSDGGVCGNGLRCLAAWIVADDLLSAGDAVREADSESVPVRIEIPSGITVADVDLGGAKAGCASVRAALPGPRFDPAFVPARPFDGIPAGPVLEADIPDLMTLVTTIAEPRSGASPLLPEETRWSIVSTGNPHLVARVPGTCDLDKIDLAAIGPRLEHAPHFPSRINVHVVIDAASRPIRMRTWERGSGITQACGTGACAVVAAMVAAGRRDGAGMHEVELPGGTLRVRWSGVADDPIRMTGPAERVARIEVDDRWLERMLAAGRGA